MKVLVGLVKIKLQGLVLVVKKGILTCLKTSAILSVLKSILEKMGLVKLVKKVVRLVKKKIYV